MRLGFLAIKTVRLVYSMLVCESHGSCCCQRNAFIGWPEKNVVLYARVDNRIGITPSEEGQFFSGIEKSRIEKIGAYSPGLQSKFTEA